MGQNLRSFAAVFIVFLAIGFILPVPYFHPFGFSLYYCTPVGYDVNNVYSGCEISPILFPPLFFSLGDILLVGNLPCDYDEWYYGFIVGWLIAMMFIEFFVSYLIAGRPKFDFSPLLLPLRRRYIRIKGFVGRHQRAITGIVVAFMVYLFFLFPLHILFGLPLDYYPGTFFTTDIDCFTNGIVFCVISFAASILIFIIIFLGIVKLCRRR